MQRNDEKCVLKITMQWEKLQALALFNVVIESSQVIVDFPHFALMSPSDTQVEKSFTI